MEEKSSWQQNLQDLLVQNGRLGYALDGIVDKSEWEKVPIKILFLLKEPPGDKNKSFDLTKFLRNGAKRSVDQTWRNVAMWVYSALHYSEKLSFRYQVKPISMKPERRSEWLSKIAAVNVKKQPGKSQTDTKALKEEFKRFYAPFVAMQLKEIREYDVVVCCGKGVFSCLRTIFDEVFDESYDKSFLKIFCQLGNLKEPIKYYKKDNLPLIIDYCHPGAHINGKEMAMAFQSLIKTNLRISQI